MNTLVHGLLGDLLRLQTFAEMHCCCAIRRSLLNPRLDREYRRTAESAARRAELIADLYSDLIRSTE